MGTHEHEWVDDRGFHWRAVREDYNSRDIFEIFLFRPAIDKDFGLIGCEHAPAVAEMVRLARENAELKAGRMFPDDSPGDVIAAEPDGTIVLDDGVTTWNPSRATAFLLGREKAGERRRQIDMLHEVLVVAANDRIENRTDSADSYIKAIETRLAELRAQEENR